MLYTITDTDGTQYRVMLRTNSVNEVAKQCGVELSQVKRGAMNSLPWWDQRGKA